MPVALMLQRKCALALCCCLALTTLVRAAFASEVIVPDNFPTITQAIASGADTVSVRQGTYPESLVIARSLVLRGLGPDGPSPGGYPLFEQPVVTAVTTGLGDFSTGLTLLDLHVLHASRMSTSPSIGQVALLRGCRFDAGLDASNIYRCDVQYCHVFGDVRVGGRLSDIGMNLVTGGTLWLGDAFGPEYAHDNVVVGPAAVGMILGEDLVASNNHVSGCTVGISIGPTGSLTENVVEDCSGSGYYGRFQYAIPDLQQNIARRCGGRGFDFYNSECGMFTGNLVDSTGQEGVYLGGGATTVLDNVVLRAGGTGIVVAVTPRAGKLSGNRVIGAGGDGIVVQASADTITGNVVGRSQGRGIVVQGTSGRGSHLHHNTVYLNGGAGLSMTNPYAAELDSINNNLSVGNAVGLQWSASYAPVLACNDWFGNTTARVIGASPSAADTTLDPLFCAIGLDDVTLAATSPLVNLAGCGSVGALGVGCSGVASVAPGQSAPAARLSVSPQPGRGPMQFAWRPTGGGARLEICDVSGARRWSAAIAPGQAMLHWSGAGSDGRGLPAGIYFARLTQGASRSQARIVIIR